MLMMLGIDGCAAEAAAGPARRPAFHPSLLRGRARPSGRRHHPASVLAACPCLSRCCCCWLMLPTRVICIVATSVHGCECDCRRLDAMDERWSILCNMATLTWAAYSACCVTCVVHVWERNKKARRGKKALMLFSRTPIRYR